ncbi:ribonuclease P protein subunit p40-like [Anopheles cruzii]|uniref:ribonuclease P protein subunit p40-like n=1 Tax=Anopheles cruzii TaxID=68878 RepID=UPI0022EC858B|nr:ribonuclease P protein subunit p40-like [Anopheles cruzii]
MLCPDLWRFVPPSYSNTILVSSSWSNDRRSDKMRKEINSRHFNHTLSIILPACGRSTANELEEKLSVANDPGHCSLVRQFPLIEALRHEFREAFVRQGTIYAITAKGRLESDDCVALRPDGVLHLSLHSETHQRLALGDSLVTHHNGKYVLKLDLRSTLSDDVQRVDRLRDRLTAEAFTCDLLIRWIPPIHCSTLLGTAADVVVSSTSLEHYLATLRRLTVISLPINTFIRTERRDEFIPMLGDSVKNDFCTVVELLEYIGMIVLGCETVADDYLNEYSFDTTSAISANDSTWLLHGQGVFTPEEVNRTIDLLARLVSESETKLLPWVALHVQGFSNVPIGRGDQGEKGICWDSDNAYTIIIDKFGKVLWNQMTGISGRGPIQKE